MRQAQIHMHIYQPKTFTIPALDGISEKSVAEHLGLYQGYVKNFNTVSALIAELATSDWNKHNLAIAELVRRRSFEFDGMRLHEHYFEQFEGGTQPIQAGSAFTTAIESAYTPMTLEKIMRNIGSMRGPGWAILYFDKQANELLTGFVGEQHQGHFATLPILLALDVWEHAYILDYGAAGKGAYIDAFFRNLNWGVVEKRLDAARM